MAFLRFMPALIVGAVLSAAGPAGAHEPVDPWVVKTSPKSVADTVSALTDAVEDAGATVVAIVDHAAGAKKAGMDLSPITLVIFGNPKLGTPLIQENRRIGIDLPMRVLVWEEGNVTRVGYLEPEIVAPWYGIAVDNPSVKTMTGALDKLTNAATAK